jgi:hypothetical protein
MRSNMKTRDLEALSERILVPLTLRGTSYSVPEPRGIYGLGDSTFTLDNNIFCVFLYHGPSPNIEPRFSSLEFAPLTCSTIGRRVKRLTKRNSFPKENFT